MILVLHFQLKFGEFYHGGRAGFNLGDTVETCLIIVQDVGSCFGDLPFPWVNGIYSDPFLLWPARSVALACDLSSSPLHVAA